LTARLERFTWDQKLDVERVLRRLEHLGEPDTRSAHRRYQDALARALTAEMAEPMTEAGLEQVNRRLGEIEAFAPAVAGPLEEAFEDRKGQWHELFALKEPFDIPAQVKEGQIRAEGPVLVAEGERLPPYVITKQASAGYVRLKATFEDWQSAPAV